MKKIISSILIIGLAVSVFSVSVSADVANTFGTDEKVYTDNSGILTYKDYVSENKADTAEKAIVLKNDSVISDSTSAKLEDEGVVLNNSGEKVTYSFNVPDTAWYELDIVYRALNSLTGDSIKLDFLFDGKLLYDELANVQYSRRWQQSDSAVTKDNYGNEFSKQLVEVETWQKASAYASSGFVTEPLKICLTKGTHTLTVVNSDENLIVSRVELNPVKIIKPYSESVAENAPFYKGKEIVFEGENADYRTDKTLMSLSDRSSPAVYPNDPFRDKINYIGGSNWKEIGQTITWKVTVPETGLYRFAINYRQTYLQDSSSYRSLLVDGNIPFAEAASIPFAYTDSWKTVYLDELANNGMLYLEKGEHEISLRVTLGDLAKFADGLKETVDLMGKIYRQIVVITGETPDSNRDYALFTKLPDLEKRLDEITDSLKTLILESEKVSGTSGGNNTAVIKKALNNVEQMLKVKYKAHTKITKFYDNYSSLSSWLYEMQEMALDIDSIAFLSKNAVSERSSVGFFKKISYSIQRLASSFADDYSSKSSSKDKVTVWCNLGRDQVNIINRLISEDFTPKTGTEVELKVTSASIIQANLSGKCPDVQLCNSRSTPVNFAMRGVLYDPSKFPDFDDVAAQFTDTALEPYMYNNGIYGLPNTQTFYMMFVRTDIFNELGLEIPTTWEEFIKCAEILYLNKMQVALPYSPITDIGATNGGVGALSILPTLMLQKGIKLYNDDKAATNLNTPEAIEVITIWTDFYKKYNFPKTYSFFNRFRIGLLPLGIESYVNYSTLSAAAPEITGKWTMVSVPGFKNDDGTISNTVSGGGNADIILKNAANIKGAWEFLKWWSSDDIQYRYSEGVESVLGVSGRNPTANINALMKLGWDRKTREELKKQTNNISEIAEIPGSYYVSRSIDQIFWNVVDGGQNVHDMAEKWGADADSEIQRKTKEYS